MSEVDHENSARDADGRKPDRSAAEQQTLIDALRDICEQRITFNRVLGLRLLPLDHEDRIEIHFDMSPDLVGHFLHGRLHGGVIASALDVAGGMSVMWSIANDHPGDSSEAVLARFVNLGTVDIRVDYLRQGIGRHFIASAETLRLGRRIGSTAMRLHNDEGKLIAAASGAYIVS
ncbi:MAG: thioesterase [Gammaproteobacteria bacterium]|nr:MAG: thioesterase [Gammaproteobacteria bacterium]